MSHEPSLTQAATAGVAAISYWAGDDLNRIRKQMEEDLQSYYAALKRS